MRVSRSVRRATIALAAALVTVPLLIGCDPKPDVPTPPTATRKVPAQRTNEVRFQDPNGVVSFVVTTDENGKATKLAFTAPGYPMAVGRLVDSAGNVKKECSAPGCSFVAMSWAGAIIASNRAVAETMRWANPAFG